MIGMGTIINTAGVLLGGIAGLLFGNRLSENMQETLAKANGLGVLFLGISGTVQNMLIPEDGKFSGKNSMLLVLSLAIGAVIGELLDIEAFFERIGEAFKRRFDGKGESRFVEGFMSATLTICIGAMVITGAIEDGILHTHDIYATKAILDFVTIMLMTCTFGKGAIFSAVPCFVIQGGLTLLAGLIEPLMTAKALEAVSLSGSALLFCIGENLFRGKSVRVANLIPAIPVAVILINFM